MWINQERSQSLGTSYLKKHIGAPGTVIDVGVSIGTSWLYQAFPESRYILVEPLSCYTETCERIIKELQGGGRFIQAAAAEDAGESELIYRVDDQGLDTGGASLFSRPSGLAEERIERVKLVRLDQAISRQELVPPVLLKTDCQGYDLKAIRGASGILDLVDAVICEVTFLNRDDMFHGIVSFMHDRGFRVVDILEPLTFQPGDILAQVDITFVKADYVQVFS